MARRASPGMPVRIPGETLNGHKAPWWHLRTWVTDLATLQRLRDGLKALPDEGPLGQPAEPEAPPAVVPLDPAIAAIRETFATVTEAGDPAIGYFYARLFVASPKLRDLFPAAMDEQRDRLFRALTRIVESLSTPEELAAYLAQLGRDHRKYRVEPVMYEVLGDALLATLRRYAGAAFTPAAEAAWVEAYTAASAIMIRAAEQDTAPARWTAEVVDHHYLGNGVAVLVVAPDAALPYAAGQHVTVQHPGNKHRGYAGWPKVWRPYPVANRPSDDGLLALHVKAVRGGWVSSALVHHTQPGDELILGPAIGGMTLDTAGDRDLLLVAGGTGLSAVKALAGQAVRDATSGGPPRRIWLFAGARTRDELYDLPGLWRLADAYDWLQVTPVASDDPAFSGMQGNVGGVAARYVPHSGCEAYAAGPAPMVRDTIRALMRAGMPRERIHFDDALLAGRHRVGTGT